MDDVKWMQRECRESRRSEVGPPSHLAGRESSSGRTTTASSWPPAAEDRVGPNRTGATTGRTRVGDATGRTSPGRRRGCGCGVEWGAPAPATNGSVRVPHAALVVAQWPQRDGVALQPRASQDDGRRFGFASPNRMRHDSGRRESPSSVTLNQFHRLHISILSKMNTVCQSKYVVAASGTFHSRLELVMLARTAVPPGAPAVRAMSHR